MDLIEYVAQFVNPQEKATYKRIDLIISSLSPEALASPKIIAAIHFIDLFKEGYKGQGEIPIALLLYDVTKWLGNERKGGVLLNEGIMNGELIRDGLWELLKIQQQIMENLTASEL